MPVPLPSARRLSRAGSSGRSSPGHPSGGPPKGLSRCGSHGVTSCTAAPHPSLFGGIPPRFGHVNGLNDGFHGHRGVVGRFRRVVVARRCTQHHLRRVMVETPPRAGPSPPHGPARFSFSSRPPWGGPRACRTNIRAAGPQPGPHGAPEHPAHPLPPAPAPAPARAPGLPPSPAPGARCPAARRRATARGSPPPSRSPPSPCPPSARRRRAFRGAPRRSAARSPSSSCSLGAARAAGPGGITRTVYRPRTSDERTTRGFEKTPAPAGVGFAPGDCHTDRVRPRPKPGRVPRTAADAAPVRSVRRG